jgi:hypothetical protein
VVVDGTSSSSEFSETLPMGGKVVSVYALLNDPYATVDIAAVDRAGKAVPILTLRNARPEWPRRYRLAEPLALPAGTAVKVKTTPGDPDIGPLGKAATLPLQIGVDIVPN